MLKRALSAILTGGVICVLPMSVVAEVAAPDLRFAASGHERQTAPLSNTPRSIPALDIQCGSDCEQFRALLSPDDKSEITTLPPQVNRTLHALSQQQTLSRDAGAEVILEDLGDGPLDRDLSRVGTGPRVCTVYNFGFLDEGSRRVGTHRCEISQRSGHLQIEKLTGEGLVALLYPYGDSVWGFAGRTYIDRPNEVPRYDSDNPIDQDNDNFGNKVGLAMTQAGRLYLLSIDESGFQYPDDTFFEVIVVQ
jgi:hypothetical protein